MEHLHESDLPNISRVVDITSDAVAVCAEDGVILHVNSQFLRLVMTSRSMILGRDIKDFVFSESFVRAQNHELPFTLDGKDCATRLKLFDGSFISTTVRALNMNESDSRILLTIRNMEEVESSDREHMRVLEELTTTNKRLLGTLSVILTTAASQSLPELLSSVLTQLSETLNASGCDIYFSEGGGFKLRGTSEGINARHFAHFIPYGAGVPTMVVREQRPLRLSRLFSEEDLENKRHQTGVLVDLDTHERKKLRIQNLPPYRFMVSVPIYFGSHVLGVLEVGWDRGHMVNDSDVQILEVICRYLSVQLQGLLTSLRAQRKNELLHSLSHVRDVVFATDLQPRQIRDLINLEVSKQLHSTVYCVQHDSFSGFDYLEFGDEGKFTLASGVEELFFSETAASVRVQRPVEDSFDYVYEEMVKKAQESFEEIDAGSIRIARLDESMSISEWLVSHNLNSQGIFIDFGLDDKGHVDGILILRNDWEESFDDMEYDYLRHLARDFHLYQEGLREKEEDQRISQALQLGFQSKLAHVPGISTDSLYLSATSQALVGGDFYELIRLPDNCAVMVLGDVSGKGVEAASMSSLVKTAVSAYAWQQMSPEHICAALNSMLLSFSRVETFVTMFVAKIDLRTHRAVYCSAGHPPARLIHPGDDPEVEMLSVQSGVLGAFEGMSYKSGVFSFSPADMLFLYTDGTLEARRPTGEFFGEQRLDTLLVEQANFGVEGICQIVLDELDEFTESTLNDDVALVALQFDR